MTGKSKIESSGHAPQVGQWLSEGKTARWIATQLNYREALKPAGEPKVDFTFTDVNRFKAKMKTELSLPGDQVKAIQVRNAEQATEMIEAGLAYLEKKQKDALASGDNPELTPGESAFWKQKGEWSDRLLKLLGLYGPGVQVGVKVDNTINPQTGVDDELRRELKRLLTDRGSTDSGGKPPESGSPAPTS